MPSVVSLPVSPQSETDPKTTGCRLKLFSATERRVVKPCATSRFRRKEAEAHPVIDNCNMHYACSTNGCSVWEGNDAVLIAIADNRPGILVEPRAGGPALVLAKGSRKNGKRLAHK